MICAPAWPGLASESKGISGSLHETLILEVYLGTGGNEGRLLVSTRNCLLWIPAVVLVFTLVTAATVTLSPGASAGRPGVLDDGKDLLPLAGITIEEAIAAAQTAASGPVDEIDLEYYQGRLVFNIDIGDQDVKVDASNARVLAVEMDD
jgi:hypothetical protein